MQRLFLMVGLMTASAATAVFGQSSAPASPPKPSKVETNIQAQVTGHFTILDWLSRLKLGSAYFLDPKAVRNLNFAYAFDPKVIGSNEKYLRIWDLAKDGKITFGIPEKNSSSVQVVTIRDLSATYDLTNSEEFAKLLGSSDIKVVADKESLLGSVDAQTLIRSNQNF